MRRLPKGLLFPVFILIAAFAVRLYSATGTPSTLVVRTDANNYLLVTSVTQTNPVTQGVFNSRTLRTDSSGSLQVVLTGTVTPTYPMSIPASTCAAPSLGESGAVTTGIAFTATPSVIICVAAAAIETITGTLITSVVTDTVALGTITTQLSNRNDTVTWNAAGVTFTGWKLNVTDTASAAGSLLMDLQVGSTTAFAVAKNGSIGVGVAPNTSGVIVTIASSGFLIFSGREQVFSAASGLFTFRGSSGTVGLEFNNGTAAPTFNNGTIDANARNSAGKVVLTGGNTGGTVTFGSPNFSNAPFCTVTGTAATDIPQITSTTAGTLVVAGITANGTFYYLCIGRV